MIHLQCPNCHSKLAVREALAGRLAACPKCQSKLRIPRPETATEDDPPDERYSAAPRSASQSQARRPHQPVEEDDEEEERPARPRRRRDEEEDEEPVRPRRRRIEETDVRADEERPPRRRRKKRRTRRPRETSSAFADMFGDVNPFWFALAGVAIIWLISFGLAFVFPPIALLPIGLGWLLSFVGGIWFLIVVFQDDVMQGVLCLLVPFYSLYYLLTNFDAVKYPFFVQVLGALMVGSGICAGSISTRSAFNPQANIRSYHQTPWQVGDAMGGDAASNASGGSYRLPVPGGVG